MVEQYFYLVVNKKRTCNENTKGVKLVPVECRAEVSALLSERGFSLDGDKIV